MTAPGYRQTSSTNRRTGHLLRSHDDAAPDFHVLGTPVPVARGGGR